MCTKDILLGKGKRKDPSAFFLNEGGNQGWIDSEVKATKTLPIRIQLPLTIMKCPTWMPRHYSLSRSSGRLGASRQGPSLHIRDGTGERATAAQTLCWEEVTGAGFLRAGIFQ